jgi:hypothetical protein
MFDNEKTPVSTYGIESSDGWNNLLYNLLCIISIIDEEKKIRIEQVKSKFGTLRFYFRWIGPKRKTIHDRYIDLINLIPYPLGGLIRKLLKYPCKKWDPNHERIRDIVNLFEAITDRICEECGEPAEERNNGHWIYTLCEKCWMEQQALRATEEQIQNENLLVSGHLQPQDL